jgi:hypothetical protein
MKTMIWIKLTLPFRTFSCLIIYLQKYRYQDEDTPPQEHISPQITNEVIAPELVHVSEKNLSEIENVHGFVSHSHISPIKVGNNCLLLLWIRCYFCYKRSSCSKRALSSCRFLSFWLILGSQLQGISWYLLVFQNTFFFFCGVEVWTQGHTLVRQAFYNSNHFTSSKHILIDVFYKWFYSLILSFKSKDSYERILYSTYYTLTCF